MNDFNYKELNTITDDRSLFLNNVSKLLYQKYDGDLEKCILEGEKMLFSGMEINVNNMYELVHNEIPLIGYYHLTKFGKDNFDYSQSEYEEALNNSINACHKYYKDSKTKTSSLELENIKCSYGWYELGMMKISDIFEYGEFGNIIIEVDKDLNIVGGKIIRFK